MRLLAIVIWLCIGVATAAEAGHPPPPPPPPPPPCRTCGPAPAPLIGTGIPAVLVVGGVLLGAKVLARRRQA